MAETVEAASGDPAPGGVAAVFVALADPRRRQVVEVIASGGSATSTGIAEELRISRQAVAKHLVTLTEAALVVGERHGREVRYRLRAEPLELTARWLRAAANAWDGQLALLRAGAEARPDPGEGTSVAGPSTEECEHA